MTTERGEVTFGGTMIRYRVERSRRRKTVMVAVDAAEGVVVRAPAELPAAQLAEVVRSKAAWIHERTRGQNDLQEPPPPREYISGEGFTYLGRQYRLKVEERAEARRASAVLVGGRLVATVPCNLAADERATAVRSALVTWYRNQAAHRLPERVALYARRAGVPTPPVLIRDQQKRWGSCSSKGELRFNWRVVIGPMTLVDYVLAHEVCHLVVRDHSAEFWKLLGTVLPDFDERRERLRVEGAGFGV